MSDTILVTGGTGYVGAHVVAAALRDTDGREVRTTVRTASRADALREALDEAGADTSRLTTAEAELLSDDGWAVALDGCSEVFHVASPMVLDARPEDVVRPAVDGTVRVLRAARDAGVRRVVLTSSFAAVGYSPKPVPDYDEDDWTDPDSPGLPPYPLSKTLAERAAWDFVEREGGAMELVALNPTFVLGPPLTRSAGSSVHIVKGMLDGAMSVVPQQRFGLVDVRDLADLHVRAMRAPQAAGRRYLALADGPTISFLQIAQVLAAHLGSSASRVPTEEAPGDEPPVLVIRNERARAELGWQPRDRDTTILDTARRLQDLGLVAAS